MKSEKLTRKQKKNADKRISNVFYKWTWDRKKLPYSLDGFINDLEKVRPQLKYILKNMHNESQKDYVKEKRKGEQFLCEPDMRRGWDTYGFDNIESDLSYISDRWRAEFRIQWVLDMLDYKNGSLIIPKDFKKEEV